MTTGGHSCCSSSKRISLISAVGLSLRRSGSSNMDSTACRYLNQFRSHCTHIEIVPGEMPTHDTLRPCSGDVAIIINPRIQQVSSDLLPDTLTRRLTLRLLQLLYKGLVGGLLQILRFVEFDFRLCLSAQRSIKTPELPMNLLVIGA